MIKHLEWDSEFFGFPVGIVKILSEPDWKNFIIEYGDLFSRYKLIYFITDEALVIPNRILERYNGHYINQRILYRKAIKQSHIILPASIEEYTDPKLTPEFLQLAYTSGSFSRFKIDQNMPDGKFGELYKIWIQNSLDKKIADKVFVSTHNNKISAMVSCKDTGTVCNIGLVAVGASEQGKGTGRFLIKKVEEHAYNSGLKEVRVPTQSNNINACNFYEKLGFISIETTNYYHFWIK